MRKIIRELAWLLNQHEWLNILWFVGSIIGFSLAYGLGVARENWLLIGISALFFLILLFHPIILVFFTTCDKNPKIAIDRAQKFLKENPLYSSQLNSLIEETKQKDDSTRLAKWLESYRNLSWKEKELARITERLKKLPVEKSRLEAEIKNLKSKLRIS